MTGTPITPTNTSISLKRRAAKTFKVCPLCGTLNVVENKECFVCSWHCHFDQQPQSVFDGIQQIIDACPKLMECMEEMPRPARKLTWWMRLKYKFRRPLDLQA